MLTGEQSTRGVQSGISISKTEEFFLSPAIYERNVRQEEPSRHQQALVFHPKYGNIDYYYVNPIGDQSQALILKIEQSIIVNASETKRKLRF